MEILNNIWNALTTENERIVNLLSIPLGFIELSLSFYLFAYFLNITYTKKQKYIYIFLSALISLLTKSFIPAPFNTLVNYIFLFFSIYLIFHLDILKTILAVIIPFVTFSIVGSLILNPLLDFFCIYSNSLNNTPIYKLIYLSTLYTLIFVFLKILNLKVNPFSNNFEKRTRKILLINLLIGIFTLVIQLIITVFYINILPLYITFLSSISLVLYLLISFYSLYHIIKLQKTTKDLENAETYNKTLSVLYDNVKAFKHDFENMVNMIGGYVKNNDIDGLREYYSGLEKDYAKIKNLSALNPTLINNSGIYNLLVKKYNKATSIGVKMDLEYFFDFEKLHMPIYQFSRMLGILIDNAIEAAEASEEKHVLIRFRDSSFHHTQIIIIENSYCSKEKIDTKNIFKKGITGKDGHMGMGLWEVHEILMKNNNVNLITSTDENIFKQQIEIYY